MSINSIAAIERTCWLNSSARSTLKWILDLTVTRNIVHSLQWNLLVKCTICFVKEIFQHSVTIMTLRTLELVFSGLSTVDLQAKLKMARHIYLVICSFILQFFVEIWESMCESKCIFETVKRQLRVLILHRKQYLRLLSKSYEKIDDGPNHKLQAYT